MLTFPTVCINDRTVSIYVQAGVFRKIKQFNFLVCRAKGHPRWLKVESKCVQLMFLNQPLTGPEFRSFPLDSHNGLILRRHICILSTSQTEARRGGRTEHLREPRYKMPTTHCNTVVLYAVCFALAAAISRCDQQFLRATVTFRAKGNTAIGLAPLVLLTQGARQV